MNNPLVSIIIPTFNRAHIISETLDSVLAQTYTNWECIVIDDGSTDGTDVLLESYCKKDSRFKYHHRPVDRLKGGNAARNYGLEVSKGEYINWLDSDDLLHFDTIKIKIDYHLKFKADVVISKHTRYFNELSSKVSSEKVFESNTFDVDFILMRNSILIGDPMIRKSSLNDVKFDENLIRVQDHDFFIRLFRNNYRYCLIDIKLYFYKITKGSITLKTGTGKKVQIDAQIKFYKKMMNEYSNNEIVTYEYKRKTRKMYISLMKKAKINRVLENYNFFRKSFKLSYLEFSFFFSYNFIFKRGYDKIMYKVNY